MQRGDIILIRLSGVKNYGVTAIWYFEEAIAVDDETEVPWKNTKVGWILKCKPVVKLPRLFSEDFKTSSKLSTKIPDFPAARIQPSIIHLKKPEVVAYLGCILKEFEDALQTMFEYMGESKSVEGFLKEILSSLPTKESTPKIIPEVEIESTEALQELEELEETTVSLEREGRVTPFGVVGERIDLPVLNYAPLNEKGVILLFGYYLKELGFSHLEEIRSGFPDAIGMKSTSKGRLQRVRIEFELKSSSFVRHNHPVDQCDVIVCWTNDWPDCPIPVIELRTALFEEES